MADYNDAMMRNRDAAVQARTKAQNRATVLQLKLIGQSHSTGLTSNLLKLFKPRPPLEYKTPPEKKKCPPYSGMAQFVSNFVEPGDPEYAPPVQKGETPAQKKDRIHKLRLEKGAIKAAEELQKYDPSNDPNVSGDPYKTFFVAKLNYETTEHRIKREFEAYGPIKRVRLVTDKVTNKPRGYAFVEYMHTRDMKSAYKQADGQKLDNRRVLVDVERGRTVPNWRPRRLGGGLGSTRVGGEDLSQKYSGREPQQIASGHTRSDEPRAREDRHADREPQQIDEPRAREDRHADRDTEKSRERGKDRDRESENSRERSNDRIRDRDQRDDRHRRDHDRSRDRDRGRDRDRIRDRDRARNHDRDRDRGRDHDSNRKRDRERGRDRPRERDQDYEIDDLDRDHGRTVERDHDDREHAGNRDEYDRTEPDHTDHGHGYGSPEHENERERYNHYDHQQPDLDNDHERIEGKKPKYSHEQFDDSRPPEREMSQDRDQEN